MNIARQPNRFVVFLAQLFANDASSEFGFVLISLKIQKMVNALMPLVTAAASIYAGIKALLGGGG